MSTLWVLAGNPRASYFGRQRPLVSGLDEAILSLAHVLMLALLRDSRRSEFFGTPLSEFAMHSTLKILYVRKAPI